jgi:hypothetical protein
VWCPERINLPIIAILTGDQRANADNRMINVFRKLVAHCGADFLGSLIEQIICGGKAADIGYCLNIPDENMWHVSAIYITIRCSIQKRARLGLPGALGEVAVPRQQKLTDRWTGSSASGLFCNAGQPRIR